MKNSKDAMKPRTEYNAAGHLDEIVSDAGAHLERIGKRDWCLIMCNNDGSSTAIWLTGKVILVEPRPAYKNDLNAKI